MLIPPNVSHIINTLNQNGYEAFIVGGCVRDSLMGMEPKDWDIATSALPCHIKKIFTKTVDTGIKHGTVTVVIDKINYDVTTYRIDGTYMDNRHPSAVFFTENLVQDLQRRDFTINAIAYHPDNGFVDPYSGMEDLKNHIIRGVGRAEDRFREDALRMLRAVRFAAQTGFIIESDTYKALTSNASLINNISLERVRDELVKIITSKYPHHLRLLAESGLVSHFSAELNTYCTKHLNDIIPVLQECKKLYNLCLAAFFRFEDAGFITNTMKYLRFDTKSIRETTILVKWMNADIMNNAYEIRKILSQIDADAFMNVLFLKEAADAASQGNNAAELNKIHEQLMKIIQDKDCCSLKDLAVTGSDLAAYKGMSGRQIGETLDYLLDLVMRNPEQNDKETLLSAISC